VAILGFLAVVAWLLWQCRTDRIGCFTVGILLRCILSRESATSPHSSYRLSAGASGAEGQAVEEEENSETFRFLRSTNRDRLGPIMRAVDPQLNSAAPTVSKRPLRATVSVT